MQYVHVYTAGLCARILAERERTSAQWRQCTVHSGTSTPWYDMARINTWHLASIMRCTAAACCFAIVCIAGTHVSRSPTTTCRLIMVRQLAFCDALFALTIACAKLACLHQIKITTPRQFVAPYLHTRVVGAALPTRQHCAAKTPSAKHTRRPGIRHRHLPYHTIHASFSDLDGLAYNESAMCGMRM